MTYEQEIDALLAEDVESVKRRERTAFDRLMADSDGRIVLFGAGNLGSRVLKCLRSVGIEPLAFTDNNRALWGSECHGIPVLSPQAAAERYGTSAVFMVTIWSLGHSFRETRRRLEGLGCCKVACTSALRWKFSDAMLPDFCQDLPHKVVERSDAVRTASRLWADDQSHREYLNQLKWRVRGDMGALDAPDIQESYFLDNIFQITPGEVFIDCGAYDGDTARSVFNRNPDVQRILAIEADPVNFQRLQQWMTSLDPRLRSRVQPLEVAVGSRHAQLRFNASGAEGASVSEDGNTTVECIPIDDLAEDVAPTFIKMDIEGVEMDALEGARGVIQKNAPILAICVYHRQEDLWRIPLFIHTLRNDYHFFLRQHDVDGWQTVCYAVPPHRLRGAGEP